MKDLKKIVADRIREREAREREESKKKSNAAPKYRITDESVLIAQQILSFVGPVLKEFARQVDGVVKYKGTYGRYGKCKAYYHVCPKNFLGFAKSRFMVSIEIGHVLDGRYNPRYALTPLIMGFTNESGTPIDWEYHIDRDLAEFQRRKYHTVRLGHIDEEWFVDQLISAYRSWQSCRNKR